VNNLKDDKSKFLHSTTLSSAFFDSRSIGSPFRPKDDHNKVAFKQRIKYNQKTILLN